VGFGGWGSGGGREGEMAACGGRKSCWSVYRHSNSTPATRRNRTAVDESAGGFKRDPALKFSHPYPPTK
jgi:hypothetical protein